MPDIKMDVNKFYDVAREYLASLIQGAAIGSSVLYNDTTQNVVFYVYNYIDTVYWKDAMHTNVAPGYYGVVACSGTQYKINPDKEADNQFIIEPGKAYVYEGPGRITAA